MERADRFDSLVTIMDRLREPGGCPWDREQTYETLRAYLVEECFEVADALDHGDLPALREELGDLLFQIVFLSRLAREDGAFTIADVIRGISEKMVRRHPHVFGSATAETAEDVVRNWEAIKQAEKPRRVLDGIPTALPALPKAQQLGRRAAQVGFDWKRPADVLDKIDEERAELRAAIAAEDREATRAELGDLLFSVAMLARRLDVDAEAALAATNRKFQERFRWIEDDLAGRGIDIAGAGFDELERLWGEAKLALE